MKERKKDRKREEGGSIEKGGTRYGREGKGKLEEKEKERKEESFTLTFKLLPRSLSASVKTSIQNATGKLVILTSEKILVYLIFLNFWLKTTKR